MSITNNHNVNNSLEFEYYSYHMDDLINLHNKLKKDNICLGIMNNSKSSEFINIIMKNLHFKDKVDNETRDNEYSDNENIEQDIILQK